MDARAEKLERRAKTREEKDSQNKIEKENYAKRMRNKRIFNYLIIVLVVLVIAYALALKFWPRSEGSYDDLAKCITEKGTIMYGTDWCTHCQDQKQKFGASFKYINFVNCDINKETCDAANITGFPTWVFSNEARVTGSQTLSYLAERTGCAE
jgi:hypothetical protein